MFEKLSQKLISSLRKIRHYGRLTEDNVKKTLIEIHNALLDADVALSVVNNFMHQVKKDILCGQKASKGLTPSQDLIKIIHNTLIKIMGKSNVYLNLTEQEPAIMLFVGLQGSGKTTSLAKIGKYLQSKKNKKVLIVSTDIYRPAGISQLRILALNSGISFFESNTNQEIINIINAALSMAKLQKYDVLLIDTAGCLSTDESRLLDIVNISKVIQPIEILLVIDSMMGQSSVSIASSFDKLLPLSGFILTKVDSDTRGGAAFSINYITGKPIKFIGVGENIDSLELFHPERLVGRILGMGDVLSLIEDIENKVDLSKARKIIGSFKKANGFSLFDFMDQLKQIRNIGNITDIVNKLPGIAYLPDHVRTKVNNKTISHMEAIINSMTIKERIHPNLICGSRKCRIAYGAGVKVQDVNKLLEQFNAMRDIMSKVNKNGMFKIMNFLRNKIFF